MSYPEKAMLKSSLQKVCTSAELCEELATQFGGVAVNCNHRVPQMAAIQAQTKTHCSDEDVEQASQLLCSYVDHIACATKPK